MKQSHFFTHILLVLSLLFFSAPSLSAQNLPRGCGQQEMHRRMVKDNPQSKLLQEQLERETAAYLNKQKNSKNTAADELRIIPVVFHVMHDFGAENISDAQIRDGVRIMNEDYNKKNADTSIVEPSFRSIIGKTKFEFRLASKDPSGNCTNGIHRVYSKSTYNAYDYVKEIANWDTKRYLNVWVVNSIQFSAGGYSSYPGDFPIDRDGIVVLYGQCGSIEYAYPLCNLCYRTLSHEAGHFFNVKHTWGDGVNGAAINCDSNDRVADTPSTIGADFNSPIDFAACGNKTNVDNFMDYANLEKMFTVGQSQRMRAASESAIGFRSSLWADTNLAFTGVTVAGSTGCHNGLGYRLNKLEFCAGNSVTFHATDSLFGSVVIEHTWLFPGGVPSSATGNLVVVNYPNPGVYDVAHSVVIKGVSDTVLHMKLLTVAGGEAAYKVGDVESFEDGFPQGGKNAYNRWQLPLGEFGWKASPKASNGGKRSLRFTPFTFTKGTIINAATPSYNLAGASKFAYLQYKYAAAATSTNNADVLKIYSSTNCGRTWNIRTTRQGFVGPNSVYTTTKLYPLSINYLTAISDTVGSFTPAPGEWRTERILLGSFLAGQSSVRFLFSLATDTSNNFYIDSVVVVDPGVASVQAANMGNFLLYPNPAQGEITLEFEKASPFVFKLFNTCGQLVLNGRGSDVRNRMDVSGLPAGVYQIRVEQVESVRQQRLVVQPQ